ncbi:unnamed protein product [Candidula unifasciata]|uniref:Rho-GAP domain-containing protein n=1 Tax=Candidula unifasciata TaxID=100452 RepID=A0A8S4AAE2_9EUPU|nr:unnamed protein product [Candidula unifasciata]
MTWLRLKKWLAFMKRKRKRQNKNFPVIESQVVVADTMSALGRHCERLHTQFVKDCGYVPVVLTNAAFVIEKNLKTKGLFQTQGNASKVNSCLNHLLAPRLSKIKHENIHDVIEAIKTFLVRLPEPLLPESVCDALITRSPDEDSTSQYVTVLTKFRNSSPHSFAILQFMMLLLKRISEFSEYNTMDVRKLATVFVLDIIKPLKLEDSNEGLFLIERMQRLPYLIMVVENIIKHVHIFQAINQTTESLPPRADVHGIAHSATEGHEDRTTGITSQNDAGEIQVCQMKDFRNELGENSKLRLIDQVARALSEPQRETEYAVDICKRCVTALPVCTSGVVYENPGSTWDPPRVASSLNLAVQESSTNPVEVSLEPPAEENNCAPSVDIVHKKATFTGKKYCTVRGATCSPSRRKSAKKDQDDASQFTCEIKSHRSMDINNPVTQNKRKRKCRSTSKKSKRELDRTLAESNGRGSDFTTFQPDEEITPWNEGSTNSDDTSVMAKTIRNPRVLAPIASTPIKFENQIEGDHVQKVKERIVTSEKVSRLFLPNYSFRTISRQNDVPVASGSNQTTSSSGTSFGGNICPTPDVCGHSSSNNTPISKDLIRGVKLKGSVGVNTSPRLEEFHNLGTKIEDTLRASEKSKETPNVKIPVTYVHETKPISRTSTATSNRFTLPTITKSATPASHMTEFVTRLRGHVNGMPPLINYPQYPQIRPQVPSQVAASGRIEPCSSHIKYRQQQLRRALRSSSSSLEQKPRRSYANDSCVPGLFVREWFVDTFLAFITVLCISLIFLVYEQDKPRGGWLR